MSVVYFLVLVGALVAIHEFGHFVAAKLLGFKVTQFSVGFGRPLIRIRGRETTYQIAAFPLGGFVRILGEDPGDRIPEADAPRAFSARPLWQRAAVVLAGPAANLLCPIAIYFALYIGHTELPGAVVGDVLPDTPAERAGIEPGDRVVSVAGESVRYWEDVERGIQSHVGDRIRIRLRRDGRALDKLLVPLEQTALRRDLVPGAGGSSQPAQIRHGLAGISWRPFLPQVGVVDPSSPAGAAGIQTGDRVISVDGRHIGNYGALERALGGDARRTNITLLRGSGVPGLPQIKLYAPHNVELVSQTAVSRDGRRTTVHGVHPAELFVARVAPGSPADVAGLRVGDRIASLDGTPIRSWRELEQRLLARPDHTFELGWERPGGAGAAVMTAELTQVRQSRTDDYGTRSERLAFGAMNDVEPGRGEMVGIDRRLSYAASRSVERTGETIGVIASGLWSIVRGQSPSDDLGGPITMFRVAAVSGDKGWEAFLLMLALVSISVGLINLLPIPVLDGGHLVLFAVQAIRRRPLSERGQRRVLVSGLAVVGAITVLALRGDVIRYIL